MISKERLQELIDKKATIWDDRWGEIQLCDKSKVFIIFDVSHKEIGYRLSGFIGKDKYQGGYIPPEELEEDVEKGKWQCEMYAIRPERFEPPVWEEFIKVRKYGFCRSNGEKSYIRIDCNGNLAYFYTLTNKKATKENYAEICKLARKLFLGEKL